MDADKPSNKTTSLLCFLILLTLQLNSVLHCSANENETQIPLIPYPDHLVKSDTYLKLPKVITVYDAEDNYKHEVDLLALYLTGMDYSINTDAKQKSIINLETDSKLGKDAYRLTINESGIHLEASGREGLLYGIQTLRQLFFFAKDQNGKISHLLIKDTPNYGYRGMHLDVSRHFMPVEFVKKYIDYLALFKMNRFHWHLVDDQGWRIEIKKYPKLTEIGSVRKKTLIGHGGKKPFKYDGQQHAGYYSQEEIREIVTFANNRGITIIPEIELPGHSRAAIASYPFLGCTSDTIDVWTRWGVSPYIYNINDTTFQFLEDVLSEVIELFPSEYIHIGGDEAIKNQWKASEKIQQQMKTLRIEHEEALQSYFINRIASFLADKGRKIIGWDEILQNSAPKDAVIMYWRSWVHDKNPAIEAAQQGHKVILTPSSTSYFDHYQSKSEREPLAIGGYTPVDSVYLKSPLPIGFPENKADFIWGRQANLWTEYIPTPQYAEYMLFPRLPALAEVSWTDKAKQDLNGFKKRFANFTRFLDAHQINYAKHIMAD